MIERTVEQMKKKMSLAMSATVVIALAMILTGCSETKVDQVSENAEKVILAMLNTPNPELYDEALLLSSSPTEEEKVQFIAKSEEITENWRTAVGNCFSEDSFTSFLVAGPATLYHSESIVFGRETEVRSLALVSRDEHLETVSVELAMDDEIQTVTVLLRLNPDGLFYEVEVRAE